MSCHCHCPSLSILYSIYMSFFEMNKAVRERREFPFSFKLVSEQVPTVVLRRRPRSSLADFSGETRVRITSKSAIHPWNLRRRRKPHAPLLPRALSGACSSRAAVPASEAAPSGLGSFVVASWVCFGLHLPLPASRLVSSCVFSSLVC